MFILPPSPTSLFRSKSRNPAPYPRDFFVHVLRIVTLYASVVSAIFLLFSAIDILLPDPLSFFYHSAADAIRRSSATLLIAYPVFLVCGRMLSEEIMRFPKKADYRVRKWLLFLTLFLAAIAIGVDLITLVYNFFSGELTVRFVLKVLVVAAIAAAVFAWFLWETRRTDFRQRRTERMAAALSGALLLAAIVAGFLLTGSPAYQRRIRLDEQRVDNLRMIQSEIVYHWQLKGELPGSLDDLRDDIRGFSVPGDPVTGAGYEYRPLGDLAFELCAVFAEPTPEPLKGIGGPDSRRPVPYPDHQIAENWEHAKGRHCFDRTIDPEIYRQEKPIRPAGP